MPVDPIEVIEELVDDAFERFEETPLSEISEADRLVVLLWLLDGEVGKGGFAQYYFNSSSDYAVETVAALRDIEADACADLVTQANQAFPGGVPSSDREKRIEELEFIDEETLEELDEGYQDECEEVYELLVARLRKLEVVG